MLPIMSDSLWRALLVAGLLAFATLALAAKPPLSANQAGIAALPASDSILPKPKKLKPHLVASKGRRTDPTQGGRRRKHP